MPFPIRANLESLCFFLCFPFLALFSSFSATVLVILLPPVLTLVFGFIFHRQRQGLASSSQKV